MLDIWKTAVEELDHGRDFVLATILSVQGACPRNAGTRLLVRNDGTMVGTIGGGLFEVQVRDLALRAIQTKTSHRELFSFCGSESEPGEMICGGQADVFIEFVDREAPLHGKIIRRLLHIARRKASAYLISEVPIPIGEWTSYGITHALMDSGGFRVGGFPNLIQLIELLRGRDMLKPAQLTELGGWEYPFFLSGSSPRERLTYSAEATWEHVWPIWQRTQILKQW